jgi:hypothetical protein
MSWGEGHQSLPMLPIFRTQQRCGRRAFVLASRVRARPSSLRLQNVGSFWNEPVRRIVSRS